MNGAHDMGGMHGFGPIAAEADEPPFHAEWERRMLGLVLAMGATGQWTLDQSRSARESVPPARYLASSYYEIWYAGLVRLMLERNLVTTEEVASGRMQAPPARVARVLHAQDVAAALARGTATARDATAPARFAVGDRVRTRSIHPTTHTRLPRYCRGKPGTIVRTHGAHVFADASAQGRANDAQWLYTVRFAATDLWGADTTAAAVHVDCWESYLESE